MLVLDPATRRALRAKAHHLHPVVSVGQHGLTPAVMHEIDLALAAHGLIKVRVHAEDRAEREAMLARIADELESAPVQHIGKLLILWREPEAPKPPSKPVKRVIKSARKPSGARSRSAKISPRERRHGEDFRLRPASRRARGAGADAKAAASDIDPAARRRRRAEAAATPGKQAKSSHAAGTPRTRAFGGADAKQTRKSTGKSAPNPRRRRAR